MPKQSHEGKLNNYYTNNKLYEMKSLPKVRTTKIYHD